MSDDDDFAEITLEPDNETPDNFINDENRGNEHETGYTCQMTQKLYGTLVKPAGGNIEQLQDFKYIEPRNSFEEILKEMNVRIATSDEEADPFAVFDASSSYDQFTRDLDKKMSESRGFNKIFDEFYSSCSNEEHLSTYLSPTKSILGLQDTIFRAFLTTKAAQTKTFEFLLQLLNKMARSKEQNTIALAHTCVSHMRHLGRLYEPTTVFNLLFEYEFRSWNSAVRDGLVTALPEIFTEFGLQQEIAMRLNDMMEGADEFEDPESFHFSSIETLKLLRMDAGAANQIRRHLVHICMKLDPSCLPSMISFALGTLLIPQNAKTDEEEATFHVLLTDLCRFMKIETLKRTAKRNSNPDKIVYDLYSHFLRFLQLDKKFWKYITSFVNRSKVSSQGKTEEDVIDQMNLFETMLVFSLMSSDCCPPSLSSAINIRILNLPSSGPSGSSKFLKLMDTIISFKKFSVSHLSSMIQTARNCLWSADLNVRTLGISIYKQLFIGMEKNSRKTVFCELMKHFEQNETECEASLDVFFKVMKSKSDAIMEFSEEIQACIEQIHTMTISNVKKLFQVMLMMSINQNSERKFEFDEIVNRFLISVTDRERFLGILALVMKIQYDMAKKHSESQEKAIRESVEKIMDVSRESSLLRGAFYEHMANVIDHYKGADEIRFINEWTDVLLKKFSNDFFITKEAENENDPPGMILKPQKNTFIEVSPMFRLIKELLILKMHWKEMEDDSMRSNYDVTVLKELLFAFNSDVFCECDTNPEDILQHHFFIVQWCRTILNAFLSRKSIDDQSAESFTNGAAKLFYMMMDSEKKIIANLASVRQWKVPSLRFEPKNEEIVVIAAEKTSTSTVTRKAKKRKSDEMEENAGETEQTGSNPAKDRDILTIPDTIKSHLTRLNLRPIVHLISLTNSKRSCLLYLCDELQQVFNVITKMKARKNLPMLMSRTQTSNSNDRFTDDDSMNIWFCIKKVVEELWSITTTVFDYFSAISASSQEVNAKLQRDMEDLGSKSLSLLFQILNSDLYSTGERLTATEKTEKRAVLIRIIDKNLRSLDQLSTDTSQSAREIGNYLIQNAEFAPTPSIAVSILDIFDYLNIEDEEMRKPLAKYALAYLKKDWGSVDPSLSKGAKFNSAVKDILKHYITLRKESDQLLAIQWILTNKVVQLVPDDDKRRSCVFSQRSNDDLLEKDDENATFNCINRSTFGVIFKTLFSLLNSAILRKEMSASASRDNLVSDEQTLTNWENASTCFLILCLLLRIRKIRTVSVLYTAIKEGKQFLITVSRKSSFIHLMDSITKGGNFGAICKKIERILSAVQQGNRVLQSIGTYAKTHKCVHLLKKFPELRAESENCLRIIHSAMVKNQCLDAFTVGLLKSRSIDGEIITDNQNSCESSDED